jgi:hypothetical protein
MSTYLTDFVHKFYLYISITEILICDVCVLRLHFGTQAGIYLPTINLQEVKMSIKQRMKKVIRQLLYTFGGLGGGEC